MEQNDNFIIFEWFLEYNLFADRKFSFFEYIKLLEQTLLFVFVRLILWKAWSLYSMKSVETVFKKKNSRQNWVS